MIPLILQGNFYLSLNKEFQKHCINQFSSDFEAKDDPRLIICPYQSQYIKHYECLKNEYKNRISQTISFVSLKKFVALPPESRR